MIWRWIVGTFSGAISTPRSPRATITASERATISSSRSTAARLLELGHEQDRPPASARTSSRSSGRCTNDSATQSTPSGTAKARSTRSFSVRAETGSTAPTTLTPLRSDRVPPTSTLAVASLALAASTSSRTLPSSTSSWTPGASAAKISGCGSGTRSGPPGVGSRSKRTRSPTASAMGPAASRPTRSLGPCRSARMPIGRPTSCSIDRMMS